MVAEIAVEGELALEASHLGVICKCVVGLLVTSSESFIEHFPRNPIPLDPTGLQIGKCAVNCNALKHGQ